MRKYVVMPDVWPMTEMADPWKSKPQSRMGTVTGSWHRIPPRIGPRKGAWTPSLGRSHECMEDRKEKKKKKEEHNSNISNQLVSKLLWLFMQILFMRIVIVLHKSQR